MVGETVSQGGSSGDSSSEEVSKVTTARGEDKLGSGDGNPESGTASWSWVTTTRTRVTATRVKRMTGKERSQC
jgi:hypothetical protein